MNPGSDIVRMREIARERLEKAPRLHTKAVCRRAGRAWTEADDQEVWARLGHLPRTAGGHLSTANGVGAMVKQLATHFGRTEVAIRSRLKHLDDPTHAAHSRLHGASSTAYVSNALPVTSLGASAHASPSMSGEDDFFSTILKGGTQFPFCMGLRGMGLHAAPIESPPAVDRTKPPTDATPATFEYDLDVAENCTGTPLVQPCGMRTLIGPVAASKAPFMKTLLNPNGEPAWVLDALKSEQSDDPFTDYSSFSLRAFRLAVATLRQLGMRVSLTAADPHKLRKLGYSEDTIAEHCKLRPDEVDSLLSGNFVDIDKIERFHLPLVATDSSGTKLVEVVGVEGMCLNHMWIRFMLYPAVSADEEERIKKTLRMARVAVVTLPHQPQVVPMRALPDCRLSVVHGYGAPARPDDPRPWNTKTDLASLFSLERGNGKVIGKALLAYKNSEMNTSGPTLEIIEVATEWRQRGYGTALLSAVEDYYKALFSPLDTQDSWRPTGKPLRDMQPGEMSLYYVNLSCLVGERGLRLSACYVNSAYASRWLQRRGFEDDDGMGEELSKLLLGDDFEDFDAAEEDSFDDYGGYGSEFSDEDDDRPVQCRGVTLQGKRCRVTSDTGVAVAQPLREGERFCKHHRAR
jgi:GNAT superfamily N-acetyltransferase